MNLTRHQKNMALGLANAALLPIVGFEFSAGSIGPGMTLWLLLTPLALISAWLVAKIERLRSWAQPTHICLFLATGTALGLTVGALLRDASQVSLARTIWLPVGVMAAVLHYSPSTRDEYLR